MSYVAARPLSIGEHALTPGDVLDDAMVDLLPPGRLPKLVAGGWIAERADAAVELLASAVEGIFDRLEALEAAVAAGAARKRTQRSD